MAAPLDGIKILDLTIFQNGPWATVMLSDMGAEVIKVEDPAGGDPGRGISTSSGQHNSYFETMNRNKRSITLNLKSDEGRAVFHRLAEKTDAITQNFRLGVVERLGVDYETIRKINPRIIYASVSGLGHEGPHARDGIFDSLGQARGGFLWMNSLGREYPESPAGGISDQCGAMTLAWGVAMGVIARERHGVGQHVQTSQLGGILMLQAMAINGYLINGSLPAARVRERTPNPLMNTYRCADGKVLAIGGVGPDRYWPAFVEILGIEHLLDDERFRDASARAANSGELIAMFDEIFTTKTRDEWVEAMRRRGIICQPVLDYAEVAEDPQARANGYITEVPHPEAGSLTEIGVPVHLPETPGAPKRSAPKLGEHTGEVLAEAGYSAEVISGLRERGAI